MPRTSAEGRGSAGAAQFDIRSPYFNAATDETVIERQLDSRNLNASQIEEIRKVMAQNIKEIELQNQIAETRIKQQHSVILNYEDSPEEKP